MSPQDTIINQTSESVEFRNGSYSTKINLIQEKISSTYQGKTTTEALGEMSLSELLKIIKTGINS
jgi:hypothetical protein